MKIRCRRDYEEDAHHVSSIVDGDHAKVVCELTVTGNVVSNVPDLAGCVEEIILVRPDHLVHPLQRK